LSVEFRLEGRDRSIKAMPFVAFSGDKKTEMEAKMNRIVGIAKPLMLVLPLVLLGACANQSDVDKLKADVASLKDQVAKAQATANAAQSSAAGSAESAKASADAAAKSAEAAQKSADEAKAAAEKAERIYQQKLRK
jgi:hypothetical protein